MSETEYGGIRPYGATVGLARHHLQSGLAATLPLASQHIQSMHGIRSIEVQIGHELIGGERTMGFGVTGHATSHIIVGKLIPESALPQFLVRLRESRPG